MYVDDPLMIAAGTPETRKRLFTVALLWMAVTGFPLAWAKAERGVGGGGRVRWIGAEVARTETGVDVIVPQDKATELAQTSRQFLASNTIGVRQLRSYCGGVSFLAGLIPTFRPFLGMLWAVLSSSGVCSASDWGTSSAELFLR